MRSAAKILIVWLNFGKSSQNYVLPYILHFVVVMFDLFTFKPFWGVVGKSARSDYIL